MKKLVFLVIIFLLVSMTFFVGCDSEEITLPTETKTVEPTSTLTPTPEPTPTSTPTPEPTPTSTPTPEPTATPTPFSLEVNLTKGDNKGDIFYINIENVSSVSIEIKIIKAEIYCSNEEQETEAEKLFRIYYSSKRVGECNIPPNYKINDLNLYLMFREPLIINPGEIFQITIKADLTSWLKNGTIEFTFGEDCINPKEDWYKKEIQEVKSKITSLETLQFEKNNY